jgi:hypothetical protein
LENYITLGGDHVSHLIGGTTSTLNAHDFTIFPHRKQVIYLKNKLSYLKCLEEVKLAVFFS